MNSSTFQSQPVATGAHPVAIPRQQVSIERLPTRRQSNEPRESMNCKSCRKRKIKCNRMRPSCEACQVFQCPCVYDAVPKKRGPKTDVLEALLKRVDGLEAKLKEKNSDEDPSKLNESAIEEADEDEEKVEPDEPAPKRIAIETKVTVPEVVASFHPSKEDSRDNPASPVETDAFLHTYFARFHGKPYYVLDESSVRQRIQLNQLPDYLCYAIWAVSSRHTPHPRGQDAAIQLSEDYSLRTRRCIDVDEPSVDCLQALLLLVMAFTASGQGKKAYMLMSSAIGMAMALELHREIDAQAQVTPVERELRRRLLWTCYLLDRFLACGSKRSSLIGDDAIALRLPSWCPSPSSLAVDGEFFQQGSNLQYYHGAGKKSQGCTGMLIDITRILGTTNKYLAAGGVKGDSHFPWHSLSTLSKIRQELDFWASGAGQVFSGLHALFNQPEATIAFLSKLIYHLIHCLVYRPFLPIDLAELAGNGQHQSWQIEATNLCFLHANALGELIDAARQANTVEWPAFAGYCICTAATVHIHGAHYTNTTAYGGEMNVFSASSDLLSREMQRLNELQFSWASVRHQSDTLQGIYNAHGELVKSMVSSSLRYAPGFHLEDFFDRYSNIGGPGGQSFRFDPAHLSMSDVVIDFTAERHSQSPGTREGAGSKRKNTSSSRKRTETKNSFGPPVPATSYHVAGMMQPPPSMSGGFQPQVSNQHDAQLQSGASSADVAQTQGYLDSMPSGNGSTPATGEGAAPSGMAMGATGFSPTYGYTTGGNPNEGNSGYDPMFGSLPTNAFSSPAAWQTEDGQQHRNRAYPPTSGVAPSPGTKSASGSTGTGHSDEKDPFLSLLEQLAEDEQRFNNPGTDLDFFFANNNNANSGNNAA